MASILKKAEAHTIRLGGETYPAKLSFRAIAELEDATGMTFAEINAEAMTGTTKYTPYVIWAMLRAGGVECSVDDIMDYPLSGVAEIDELVGKTVEVTYEHLPEATEEVAKGDAGELKAVPKTPPKKRK